MLTLKIDGIEVQVTDGANLVQAAAKAGIEIPTYCYHPGLTVVGQCRICFVEVEGMPRLVTACSTPAGDGMVVQTASERVKEARAAVMEFLLENHPLDCPVCDQAGECLLQDYSVEHGTDTTHMVDERRTYPGYERRAIGPHVVQNQNRCIHCTRCIRFTQEIAETNDLTMKSRGNHSYIDTFDGEPLVNPWSACVADVCPVGALTVKEFRFRARVWHLDETESICPGCSIGCNVTLSHLKGVVHRFTPRANTEINGWWLCDFGRFLAEGLNDRDIEQPTVRSDGGESTVAWRDALENTASLLSGASASLIVVAADLSNEALYLAKRLFADSRGLEVVVPVHSGEERRMKNGHGEWIQSADAHANAAGARLIGLRTVGQVQLEEAFGSGSRPIVIIDPDGHPWLQTAAAAKALAGRDLVVAARRSVPLLEQARVVLPLASWVECEGTYTSSTGRVQLARRGLYPRGEARPAWEIVSLLAVATGDDDSPVNSPRSVFEQLVGEVPAFAGMTYRRLVKEPGIPTLEEVPHVG